MWERPYSSHIPAQPNAKPSAKPPAHPGQVRPRKHPQAADEQGDGHHHAARGGVEVEPHRRQHGGAQCVAGGAGIAVGLLRHQRRKAGLLIRAGKVQPARRSVPPQNTSPGTKNGPGNDLHKVQSAACRCPMVSSREPRTFSRHQQHRIADKRHERQPAVQQNDQPFCRAGGPPASLTVA